MKTVYENQNGRIRIWRCYTYGSEAEIPAYLDGCPVTELAPYAFSAHMDEEALAAGLREGRLQCDREDGAPALKGMGLTALALPKTLEKIGAYAFYNCNALEKLSFSESLRDLGAGLFTGCHHMKRLEVTLTESEASCLQEMLMELPEKLSVHLRGKEEARLIFPEFYEEGVENTPARILMTQMHGSGMNYRNCFYQKKFDFHAYDRCFYRAKAEEDFETVFAMAFGRLSTPWELSLEAKAEYEGYIREHLEQAGEKAAKSRDGKLLAYLTETFILPDASGRELLQREIDRSAAAGFAEGTAYLLDTLHRNYSSAPRSFDL